MVFLFPSYPYSTLVDEDFKEELEFIRSKTINQIALYDVEQPLKLHRKVENQNVIYRGWMLDEKQYKNLEATVSRKGGNLLTKYEDYFNFHYINNWYETLKKFTFETKIFNSIEDLQSHLEENPLNEKVVVKDFVKTLTTSRNSFASTNEEVFEIIKEMKKYTSELRGGIVLRKFDEYLQPETEERFFIFNNEVIANKGIPTIINEIVKKLNHSGLYTIDIVKCKNNEYKLVEVGDGQVSSLKENKIIDFYKFFQIKGKTNDKIKTLPRNY